MKAAVLLLERDESAGLSLGCLCFAAFLAQTLHGAVPDTPVGPGKQHELDCCSRLSFKE